MFHQTNKFFRTFQDSNGFECIQFSPKGFELLNYEADLRGVSPTQMLSEFITFYSSKKPSLNS
jgi:hypothetical protein